MRRIGHGLAVVAVVIASNAGDSGCESAGSAPMMAKACEVDTRGIQVERGIVVDLVTVRCDPPPRKHTLEAWLEYRGSAGEPWIQAREPRHDFTIPDAEGTVTRVPVEDVSREPGARPGMSTVRARQASRST